MLKKFKIIRKLTRLNLSLAITFSALAGYIFYMRVFNWKIIFVFFGVLFISCAASALNQYQERDSDAIMGRTVSRPIPAKNLKSSEAIIITIIFGLMGILMLFFGAAPLAAALGAFNLLWYNAVYTPLKKKTRFAVLIGALTGAIPPLIGWTAAGGSIINPTILSIALFMYLWQIPHFLLLALKYGKEYEAAGFVSITEDLSQGQIKLIIFIWLLGSSACTLLFPLFNIISGIPLILMLLILNWLIIFYFYKILFSKDKPFKFKFVFRSIYFYQALILVMLIIDRLFIF